MTAKGLARGAVTVQWGVAWIFLALAVALLAGMALNLTGWCEAVRISELTALDVGWSLYTLFVLALCGLACVELPRTGHGRTQEVARADVLGTVRSLCKRLFT